MRRQKKCPIANMVCPKNADPERGAWCPCWIASTWENPQTGDIRHEEGCFFQEMPRFWIEGIKAANRPAASFDKTCNEMVERFDAVNRRVAQLPALMSQRMNALEDRSDES